MAATRNLDDLTDAEIDALPEGEFYAEVGRRVRAIAVRAEALAERVEGLAERVERVEERLGKDEG